MDLCTRLPYDVIVYVHDIDGVDYNSYLHEDILAKVRLHIITAKPYLRPLSSMTEEEDKQRIKLGIWRSSHINGYSEVTRISPDNSERISERIDSQDFRCALTWLLQNHFDIFGLITKGLAIEVTEDNNPYKEK